MQGQAPYECKAEPQDDATCYYGADYEALPSPQPLPSPVQEEPLPSPDTEPLPSPAAPTFPEDSPSKPRGPPEPPSSLEPTQVDVPEAAEPQGSHQLDNRSDDDKEDEEQYAVASKPPPPLSKDAVYHKMRRIMQPRADGSYLLSQDFRDQYKDRVAGRPKLEAMFEKAGYNPEP